MKTTYLTALVIDQDKDQGNIFANMIKGLFSKVYVQHDLAQILAEFEEAKPLVLFFSLSLMQRTASFEWREKLPLNDKNPSIYFGYLDSHEPELVAHAIENGFHDIFYRPYDADIIATKVNRFFQSDKTQNLKLKYSELRTPLKAHALLDAKLMNVDENGISFLANHYVSKGASFTISNQLVQQIFDKDSVEMMVTRTWMGEDWHDFHFFAEPKNHNEETSAALRRFILKRL